VYRELTAKVDAFFARVASRHADDMRCAPGCDMCCHDRLTVTTVEADAVRAFVAELRDDARARLRECVERDDPCVALDGAGRCQIYDARPLVCRSHGVPIKTRAPGHLPVITSCELNFTARGPAAADADCVLDQTTLSATLLAIDRASGGDGARHELADVLRAALA